jgi:hypothetical protein
VQGWGFCIIIQPILFPLINIDFFPPARPIWPPWREGEGPTVAVEQGEDDVAHVVGQLDFGYGAGHLLHGGCGGVRETG